jgi:hypothetical protein
MLHITNGSSVSLPETGLGGEILIWVDSLHGHEASLIPAHDEIALWFEHDLYDQAQLIHILDHLRNSPAHISLIQSRRYLGPMAPAELAALWPTRHQVTESEFALASAAWRAFRAPDPAGIRTLLAKDTSALPYLAAALRRYLQQLPSPEDGLARTQRQILEILAAGPRTFAELFVEDQKREEAMFLGDTHFLEYLRALNGCVSESEGRYSISSAGRDILAGKARFTPWGSL